VAEGQIELVDNFGLIANFAQAVAASKREISGLLTQILPTNNS
jgi:hypothetical protein